MKKDLSVLVIGIGNMGSALVKGLLKKNKGDFTRITIYDQSPEKMTAFHDGGNVTHLKNLDGKRSEDVVIFCIKPQDFLTVSAQLTGKLAKNCSVISIMAGVPTEDIAKALGRDVSAVRAMPNIAGLVGQAATAMCANENTSEETKAIAQTVFESIGEAYWTKESLMDAVTGLSGSGPAYVYMVIEALTDGGVKMGLPRPLASALATQTVLGAADLVKTTGLHPAVLRDQVTTPGGTTINAIHELEAHGLRAMLMSAVATATKQSSRLRKKAAAVSTT